jgi:hypothetical protein
MAAEFFVRFREDEHVPGEMAVPREFGDNPDGHPVGRIGARVAILNKEVPSLEVTQ